MVHTFILQSNVSTGHLLMRAILRALAICAAVVATASASTITAPRQSTPRALKVLLRLNALRTDFSGRALAWAVESKQRTLAEMLLLAGANPNSNAASGVAPWMTALKVGDWSMCLRLLEAGANPNQPLAEHRTALMLAAKGGTISLMEALLKGGADVEAADSEGLRALHYAIAARNLSAVKLLLEAKALVAGKVDAFQAAVDCQDWDILTAVLEKIQGRAWDTAGRSALKLALNEKDVEGMRLVMSKHSGPVTPEGCKVPLLAYAVVANDVDLTRILLEAGADPNTPIGGPAEARFLEYVPHKFLRHYLTDEPGMTVLIVAAGMGNEAIVRMLIEHGAEKFRATKSRHKLIPLYFAAWGGHAECIQTLIGNAPAPDKVRIEISLTAQQATLYKDGVAIYRTEISSGQAQTPTPRGRFVVTDKKTFHMSNLYHAKMPFFMRLSCKDFGMHEGELPGYPASHGCIRLPGSSARKLFKEVPIGTLVTIR